MAAPPTTFRDITPDFAPHPLPISQWQDGPYNEAADAYDTPTAEHHAQALVQTFFSGFTPRQRERESPPPRHRLSWFFPTKVDLVDLRVRGAEGMPDVAFWNSDMQQAVIRRMTPTGKAHPSCGVRQADGAVYAYTLTCTLSRPLTIHNLPFPPLSGTTPPLASDLDQDRMRSYMLSLLWS
ncbi:hypothetical protein IAT38_005318 [Cryptococcus sp. DSM 104549]